MSFAGSTVAALAWIAWDTLIHLDLEVSSFLLFSHNQTAQAWDRRYSASGGELTILCAAIYVPSFAGAPGRGSKSLMYSSAILLLSKKGTWYVSRRRLRAKYNIMFVGHSRDSPPHILSLDVADGFGKSSSSPRSSPWLSKCSLSCAVSTCRRRAIHQLLMSLCII